MFLHAMVSGHAESANVTQALELDDDSVRREIRVQRRRVDTHFRVDGCLIRIVNTREARDDARPGFCIQPLAVAALTDLERRRDVRLHPPPLASTSLAARNVSSSCALRIGLRV
jgi:hypothetical protein